MPVLSGFVEGRSVSVLRDTGCSGVIVCRGLVDDDQMTDKAEECVLAHGDRVKISVETDNIDSPFYKH